MTRFCDEAIGIRSKAKKFLTRKDMIKEMEEFKKTGRHAALEQASTSDTIPALPEADKNRPHVFMDIKVRGNVLGECSAGLRPFTLELVDIDMSSKRHDKAPGCATPWIKRKIMQICRISGASAVATIRGLSDKICKAYRLSFRMLWRGGKLEFWMTRRDES
jgi:hypothetical protein